jgi:tRNA A37 threonylcarbamoyladenosine dehydratase
MNDNFKAKFEAVARVYGDHIEAILMNKHVLIVGLGGVGSWAFEALVRSGIHNITIIDFDDICVSNTNRQVHTNIKSYGKFKTDELKARALSINPEISINIINEFLTEKNINEVFNTKYDFVIDCIDSVKNKCILIAKTREKQIPIIVTGGVGGKKNPFAIQLADLNRSYNDKLLMHVRKKLKREYGFPPFDKKKFNIPCLFSPEEQIHPDNLTKKAGLNCQNGFGSLLHVTGTMGFMASSYVLNTLLAENHD